MSHDHRRHSRHRRRPRRPGRQQAAHRRRPRPRRPRQGARGRALAHRALGLPAPADPELDDTAARLELRGTRPRRVPRGRCVRRPPRGVRRLVRCACARRHDGGRGPVSRVAAAEGTPSRRTGGPGRRTTSSSRPDRTAFHGRACWPRERRRAHLQRVPQPRPAARQAAYSSSAPRRRGCRSPTSSPGPVARWSSPSAATPGCRAATAGSTSTGGWSAPAAWPRTIDEMPDPVAARHEPSLQLVGRNDPDRSAPDLDLGVLQSRGVRLAGRLHRLSRAERRVRRRPASPTSAPPTEGMHRFLDRVDSFVDSVRPRQPRCGRGRGRAPVRVANPPRRLDLRAEGIGTIVVAAGFRPHHPWLQLPITDPDGRIRQHRGITAAPGVYTVGQRFQHRRDSGLIDGARHDAAMVVSELLDCSARSFSSLETS